MEARPTPIAAASLVVAALATVALGTRSNSERVIVEPGATESVVRVPTASSPLDLNGASESEIESLPRVGPRLAARIVAARDELGGFRSLRDLDAVSGVGPSLLARIAPLVRFGPVAVQNRSNRNPTRPFSVSANRASDSPPPGP